MKFLSWIYVVIFIGFLTTARSQHYGYDVLLKPIDVPELGGLQSYAYGSNGDDWLILGGRLDGLHRRQPFASFDPEWNNLHISVINPKIKKVWSKSTMELPADLKEQLASTNMQFCQRGNHLILTGGYAYSESAGDFITFPFLTVIDVPGLINAVKTGSDVTGFFTQIKDDKFAVTGGRMAILEDVFYLVGGHKFMGRYNPMGPDHGPGFRQIYTHEIRKFVLNISDSINVSHLLPIHDELHLRRRDYNLVSTINNGEKELMLYSGVFQKNANLPWLYPVRITTDTHYPLETFSQRFNHYHTATLPIYNKELDEMHHLFFGGIAQFYMEDNMVVQDNDVPFVKTVTDVIRSNGQLMEIPLDVTMPGFLGAGAEFILDKNAPLIEDGILDGDAIGDQYIEIGYIYGGIVSEDHNVFWINTGKESSASSVIFSVSLKKRNAFNVDEKDMEESSLLVFPNPESKSIRILLTTEESLPVSIDIYDLNGIKIEHKIFASDQINHGFNILEFSAENIGYGAYYYDVIIGEKRIRRKVIWSE